MKKNRSFPIPIPDQMKHLPFDNRGFPIPHVVFIDNDGTPHFKINDEKKNTQCLKEGICHVCGNPLSGEFWFIGGHLSAYHPRGAFNDGAVHYECGLFALNVCPYMAYTQYKVIDGHKDMKRLADKLAGKADIDALFNPTQDNKRLDFFCFVKAKNYNLTQHPQIPGVFLIIPTRPYIQEEFYRDGVRIQKEDCLKILKEKNEQTYIP